MHKLMSHLKAGDRVELRHNKTEHSIFLVRAKSDDEVILMGPNSVFAQDQSFPSNKIVIGMATTLKGFQLKNGDQVEMKLRDGKKINFFITYIIGQDGLVLSLKKKSSHSSLNWLFKMMNED